MKFIKLILLLLSLLAVELSIAQSTDKDFPVPEIPAEFPGGYTTFYYFVSDSLQYPIEAKAKGIEGKVYVQFIIDENGKLVDESVKAVKSDNDLLNQAAIDVIMKSPNWIPARLTKQGEAVKQRIVLPITFKLTPGKRKHKRKNRNN